MIGHVVGTCGGLVGVLVVDNVDNDHELSVDTDRGVVAVHDVDAYPDDVVARTPEQTERVRQAQRYAKHLLASDHGSGDAETSGAAIVAGPERIASVEDAVVTLSDAAFREHFEAFHERLAGAVENIDPEAVDTGEPGRRHEVFVHLDESGGVDAVSDPLFVDRRLSEPGQSGPSPGEYDVRLSLSPGDVPPARVDSLESFRRLLRDHLSCQIRDYFLRMGELPPMPYRVLGPGHPDSTDAYRRLSLYDDYHDRTATVDWVPR